jgi:hypothetical protein
MKNTKTEPYPMKNTKLNRYILVSLQFEGIHRWKECPFKEVDFLKDYHRHIFYVEITKEVKHNDRDIEIIMLKREVLEFLGTTPVHLGNQSCEDIAEKLLIKFEATAVKVTEDNENGAIITI